MNIIEYDLPQKKTDLVKGRYELLGPPSPTTVAVRITDMLGEDVLAVSTV